MAGCFNQSWTITATRCFTTLPWVNIVHLKRSLCFNKTFPFEKSTYDLCAAASVGAAGLQREHLDPLHCKQCSPTECIICPHAGRAGRVGARDRNRRKHFNLTFNPLLAAASFGSLTVLELQRIHWFSQSQRRY